MIINITWQLNLILKDICRMSHEILSQYFEDIDDSMFIFQNILALMGRENTQGVAFINRLAAVADVELSIDVAQVLFYSCR